MPVPETNRQYLPDLEARWKLTRRKILELARDGKLPLWIHLINVKLLRIADKSKHVDWTPHAEVKFFGTSLHQLCEHAGKGNGFLAHVYNDGEVNNAMGGICRVDQLLHKDDAYVDELFRTPCRTRLLRAINDKQLLSC